MDTLESPSTSTSPQLSPSIVPQHGHPTLTSQYSNVPDSHFLEELLQKIKYYNKRAINYYILIDLFYPDTVELLETSVPQNYLNEPSTSDDSGLDSSFTSA